MTNDALGGVAPISEEVFERILQAAADAIVTVDEQQRIVHFNRGAEQIFGYATSEVLGQPLGLLLPTRFRHAHSTYVREFGESGETARLMGHRREVYGIRKGGDEFPCEASILKLDTSTGRRLYTALVRDVTDRKRMDQQRRFLAEVSAALSGSLEYESTLESVARLPVPALADVAMLDVIDESGAIRRVVASQDSLLGVGALRDRFTPTLNSPAVQIDTLQSRRTQMVDAITPEWLDAHCETADEVALMRDLGIRSLAAIALVARDQVIGVITLMSTSRSRRYEANELGVAENFAGRAALAIDNARLYRDARRATRARDDVLGIVSHELRNPLSAIAMCSRVLADTPPADAGARREMAETIHESASWMSRMIQDLLDVSAIEAGVLSVVREDAEVGRLVARAADLFMRAATARDIALAVSGDAGHAVVRADPERISQAVANLIGNAIKFTPSGGRVGVTIVARDDDAVISVEDTGYGIAEADLAHIFDRYWHAKSARGGAGLGLAIVRGIVEAHDGRIEVESTPGVGSRFSLIFPCTPGHSR